MNRKQIILISFLIIFGSTVFILFFSNLGKNILQEVTNKEFILPSESNYLTFEVLEGNSGSGDWWIYSKDDNYYYHADFASEKNPYKILSIIEASQCENFSPTDFSTWCKYKKNLPTEVPSNFYFYLSGESDGGLRFGTYIELEKNMLTISDYPNEIKTYELSNEQVYEFYSLVLEKDLFNYQFTWDEVVYGSGCMDCSPQAEHVLRIKAGENIIDINLWEELGDETYRINQDYELLSELEQKLISFIDSKDQSDN